MTKTELFVETCIELIQVLDDGNVSTDDLVSKILAHPRILSLSRGSSSLDWPIPLDFEQILDKAFRHLHIDDSIHSYVQSESSISLTSSSLQDLRSLSSISIDTSQYFERPRTSLHTSIKPDFERKLELLRRSMEEGRVEHVLGTLSNHIQQYDTWYPEIALFVSSALSIPSLDVANVKFICQFIVDFAHLIVVRHASHLHSLEAIVLNLVEPLAVMIQKKDVAAILLSVDPTLVWWNDLVAILFLRRHILKSRFLQECFGAQELSDTLVLMLSMVLSYKQGAMLLKTTQSETISKRIISQLVNIEGGMTRICHMLNHRTMPFFLDSVLYLDISISGVNRVGSHQDLVRASY